MLGSSSCWVMSSPALSCCSRDPEIPCGMHACHFSNCKAASSCVLCLACKMWGLLSLEFMIWECELPKKWTPGCECAILNSFEPSKCELSWSIVVLWVDLVRRIAISLLEDRICFNCLALGPSQAFHLYSARPKVALVKSLVARYPSMTCFW